MPLFVFISGYFTRPTTGDKLKKSTLKIAETLVVFTLFRWMYTRAFPHSLSGLMVPEWTLWYLLSLIYWRLTAHIFPVRRNKIRWLAASMLLCILAGFIHRGNILSVSRTFVFMPFFLLGIYCQDTNLIQHIRSMRKGYSLLFLALVLVLSCLYNKPLNWVTWGSMSYHTYTCSLIIPMVLRAGYMVIAFFMSAAFINVLPCRNARISQLGESTMFYYLYHTSLIWLFNTLMRKSGLPTNCVTLTMGLAGIILLLTLLRNNKILNFVINPITNLQNRK